MAIKKSELYSSLWQSCDELRGGMDASQYKDYVLVLLFIKYVSDKWAGQHYAPITIPNGASFADMVALKGTADIGDQINKTIIAPLAEANKLSDFPDFNDDSKLGSGKEMVDRLTNLIAIFENEALDFSKNLADGDDILGDAYEYLMRHFATESGKSKGQFYTPAEVSRVMAQISGIREADTSASTTVYDPTCGSGSLLLKVAEEAGAPVTLNGQEKDSATSGLARMNMILHDNPTALIARGNTLTNPEFMEGGSLKTFDYVVANPPFSDKRWSTGLDPLNDPHNRFQPFGVPPAKQGDFAYLLHIVRSLKSTGKGACILPHGVLFRGNVEADIRRALVRRGYIKAIIGLPANLFYGTGIPACIVVLDKEDAQSREGIFMIDASDGFIKEGPKNFLREMDVHKIVDVFNRRLEVPRYSRTVPFAEIEQNGFNLHLPRYIDSSEPEDLQDIEGHLRGGTPAAEIDALRRYWDIFPRLRHALFVDTRPSYVDLRGERSDIGREIVEDAEFADFVASMSAHFAIWRQASAHSLKASEPDSRPSEVIAELAEGLLAHYNGQPLIDSYNVYQHLMDYWAETMQDDCYMLAVDGWKAETSRVIATVKTGKRKGREKHVGWTCDLVPKPLIVARYFAAEQTAIDEIASELEAVTPRLVELKEEYGGEGGALRDVENKTDVQTAWDEALEVAWGELRPADYAELQRWQATAEDEATRLLHLKDDPLLQALKNDKGRVTQAAVKTRLKVVDDGNEREREVLDEYLTRVAAAGRLSKVIKDLHDDAEQEIVRLIDEVPESESLADVRILREFRALLANEADLKSRVKEAEAALDAGAYAHYSNLTPAEIQTLVVDDKWLATLETAIQGEMSRIGKELTERVEELVDRYETPMPEVVRRTAALESRVAKHLEAMGFTS